MPSSSHTPYGRILSMWFEDPNPPHIDLFTRVLYNQHLLEIQVSDLSDAIAALGTTVSTVAAFVESLTSNTVTQADLDAANAALAAAEAEKATIQAELDAANTEIANDTATITSLNAQLAAVVPVTPAP